MGSSSTTVPRYASVARAAPAASGGSTQSPTRWLGASGTSVTARGPPGASTVTRSIMSASACSHTTAVGSVSARSITTAPSKLARAGSIASVSW